MKLTVTKTDIDNGVQETKVCRYNWQSAGSRGINIFQIKYTEAFLSSISWKLLWFKITTMLTAVEKKYIDCVICCNFRYTFFRYTLQQRSY